MTQDELEAGRRWLERRSNGDPENDVEFSWYGRMADQEPALLAFVSAYQARLEADSRFEHAMSVDGPNGPDDSYRAGLDLEDSSVALDAAWLALIGAAAPVADAGAGSEGA